MSSRGVLVTKTVKRQGRGRQGLSRFERHSEVLGLRSSPGRVSRESLSNLRVRDPRWSDPNLGARRRNVDTLEPV